MRLYLCWKRSRRPRLDLFRICRTAWPAFSGRATLAAAEPRARCVLMDGCPVVSVHCSFGLARHVGQRTDNTCLNVSSRFTAILFTAANLGDGQSCSFWICLNQNGINGLVSAVLGKQISTFKPQSQGRIRTARFHSGCFSKLLAEKVYPCRPWLIEECWPANGLPLACRDNGGVLALAPSTFLHDAGPVSHSA